LGPGENASEATFELDSESLELAAELVPLGGRRGSGRP
jgi:hypothetical protein